MKALFFIWWCFSLISFLTTSHCVANQASYSSLSLRKDIQPPAVRWSAMAMASIDVTLPQDVPFSTRPLRSRPAARDAADRLDPLPRTARRHDPERAAFPQPRRALVAQ